MTFPMPFLQAGILEFGITSLSPSSWDHASSLTHTFDWGFEADDYCHLITCHYQATAGAGGSVPRVAPTIDGVQMGNIDLNYIGTPLSSTSTLGCRSTAQDDGRAFWFGHLNVAGKSSALLTDLTQWSGASARAYLLTGMTNCNLNDPLGFTDAIIDSNSCGNDDGGNSQLQDLDLTVTTTSTSFALVGGSDNLSDQTGVGDVDDFLQGNFGWDMDHAGGSLGYAMRAGAGSRMGSVIVIERP